MDTTKYAEGKYLTPKLIKDSPQEQKKVGVILSDVTEGKDSYGKDRLSIQVSFDKKIKTWNMNQESVRNMQKIDKDSTLWLERKVSFIVRPLLDKNKEPTGKEQIIGEPILD